jgi:NTP pyrophosphatase (non-canonical NTP hydrolase)
MATIQELQDKTKEFVDSRDWRQFQTIKELAVSASVESNELLELFQWQDGKELDKKLLSGADGDLMKKIKNETADVFLTCLAIADHAGFDMEEAFLSKLSELDRRYKKEQVKGKSVKIPSDD